METVDVSTELFNTIDLSSTKTSRKLMVSVSPFGFVTIHWSPLSLSVFGEFIQFNGLYAPPSAWIATHPSAFTMMSRTASGRWADSRPA
jgi:hypothetical protein